MHGKWRCLVLKWSGFRELGCTALPKIPRSTPPPPPILLHRKALYHVTLYSNVHLPQKISLHWTLFTLKMYCKRLENKKINKVTRRVFNIIDPKYWTTNHTVLYVWFTFVSSGRWVVWGTMPT